MKKSLLVPGAIIVLLILGSSCAPFMFPVPPGGINPRIVYRYSTPTPVISLDIQDNLLYTAQGDSGIEVFNITTPDKPRPFYKMLPPRNLNIVSIKAHGDILYAGTGTTSLNVSNPYRFLAIYVGDAPNNIKLLHSMSLSGPILSIEIQATSCYINEAGIYSVELLDISTPSRPKIVNFREGGSEDIAIYHNYVFTVGDTLSILEKTVGDSLTIVATVPLDGNVSGNSIVVASNCAYIATTEGLKVYDVKNISRPKETFNYRTTKNSYGVDVKGNKLYLANGSDVLIFSIGNPRTPRLLAQLNVGATIFSIKAKNDYVYLGTDKGIAVLRTI